MPQRELGWGSVGPDGDIKGIGFTKLISFGKAAGDFGGNG